MPNSDSRLDERIRKELKELEAPYNEAHWNEIEPFVSNLAPRSNFKIGSRTILGISLLIILIVATYFALPFLNRETKEPAPATEISSEDTVSTDPGFRPETISKPAPIITPPATTTTADTAKVVQDTVAAKVEAPVEKEIKKDTPPTEPKPKKKKKKETKKEDTPPTPEPEEGDNDLLKKDVPIIAVPQDEPAKEEPKKEEPVTP